MADELKTAGDMRGFLLKTMQGIRDGSVKPEQASAISKLAAQVNQSMQTEITAAIHLHKMEQKVHTAGQLPLIDLSVEAPAPKFSSAIDPAPSLEGKSFCDECEEMRDPSDILACRNAACPR